MTTIEKLKDIEDTKGINAKRAKIISYLDDFDFVSVMRYLLDKGKTSGLKQAKFARVVTPVIYECHIINSFVSFLDYITINNNGKDANVYIAQVFCKNSGDEIFTQRIITKSLKLGIGLKKLKDLPEFKDILMCNVQLAESFFEYPDHAVDKDIILTEKLDGNRCIGVIENSCTLLSRENKAIEGFDEIEAFLIKHFNGYVLDGELIVYDESKDSSEMFKETQTAVRTKASGKTGVQFRVFDILTIKEYESDVRTTSCYARKQMLHSLLPKSEIVVEVPILYYGPFDLEIVDTHLQMMLKKGAEGLMINVADAVYQSKRTRDLLKMKVMKDIDLRIIGFKEGANKLSGSLGALLVDYKGFVVKVGSGFSENLRQYIWDNQQDYVDKIVKVQYFEESIDAEGDKSLRFPVFVCFRDDKKEPSYS